ncbi:MAG: type II toxin-antitoxin system HipA family toxin [Victivallales bacterium]|jgi:serine/threonine-protein kinase HipA|nr:type II toxin-antitoxin system HipA family toxin [Victivallales bacterium]
MSYPKTIYVYFDHDSHGEPPALLGILSAQISRGQEVFSFEFDRTWLQNNPGRSLDPDLQLYGGPQFTPKANFGLFMDSAPDRWGRKLMLRRESIRAREAAEKPRTLTESDYLLGVYDETRMGAIRFKTEPDGAFLNDDSAMAAPPWARLRELEEACRHFEEDGNSTEHKKWLSMLIAPGSSLGGARPKASVTDPQGNLWIAKFPSRNDSSNASAWEYATMLMAGDIGLRVPETKLEKFSKFGSTFLARRFDRQGSRRIHFSSAMTLLGKTDADADFDNSSYLDLAELIMKYGAKPEDDLRELWTRIVFSIAVSNTDDHLRNHGFLLTDSGWMLSPVYDVNPNAQGYGLSLNITGGDNSLDFSLATEVAPLFRLGSREAESIIGKICDTVSNWRSYADRVGISRSEQGLMQNAFRAK